jgi:hypothetical protein
VRRADATGPLESVAIARFKLWCEEVYEEVGKIIELGKKHGWKDSGKDIGLIHKIRLLYIIKPSL